MRSEAQAAIDGGVVVALKKPIHCRAGEQEIKRRHRTFFLRGGPFAVLHSWWQVTKPAVSKRKKVNREQWRLGFWPTPSAAERRPREPGTILPILSLSELNAIVRGFGWSFSPADSQGQVHHDAVWLVDNRWRSMFLTEQGPIIADACEDAGSRWCEPIREAIQNRHVLRVDISGFALTD